MKICRFCHRETFDGRTTCHRCGADVAATPPIALPSRDAATWMRPGPFTSRIGDLALSIDGMVFYAEDGRPLLEVPTRTIRRVRGAQARDLIVDWEDSRGRRQRARMRVRWAPQADRTLRTDRTMRDDHAFAAAGIRTGWAYGTRMQNRRGRRTRRDYAVVRDRWQSGLEMLLAADRYALDRRPPGQTPSWRQRLRSTWSWLAE